jgi:hypothetical protein
MRITQQVLVIRNGVKTVYDTPEAAAASLGRTVVELEQLMFDFMVAHQQKWAVQAHYLYTEAQEAFLRKGIADGRIYEADYRFVTP